MQNYFYTETNKFLLYPLIIFELFIIAIFLYYFPKQKFFFITLFSLFSSTYLYFRGYFTPFGVINTVILVFIFEVLVNVSIKKGIIKSTIFNFIYGYFIIIIAIILIDQYYNFNLFLLYSRISQGIWPFVYLESTLSYVFPFFLIGVYVISIKYSFKTIVIYIIMCSALLFLQRRGPLLVLLFIGILNVVKIKKEILIKLIPIFYLLMFIVIIFYSFDALQSTLSETTVIRGAQSNSNGERFYLYLYLINEILNFNFSNILFGKVELLSGIFESVKNFNPHNLLLMLIVGFGLFGLIPYSVLIFRGLKKSKINNALFYLLFAMILLGISESVFSNFGFVTILFYYILILCTNNEVINNFIPRKKEISH